MEKINQYYGFAKFDGVSVLVIGQEKGDDLDSRIRREILG